MLTPTVYIPNLNGGQRLMEVLASLAAQTSPARVVVVDNGSTDGSGRRARAEFSDLRLLELGTNVGFGRAINAAVKEAPSDPLVLLNNDAVCEPRFVEALLAESGAGHSVAGVMLQSDDPSRIDSAGVNADQALFQFEHLHGEPASSAEGGAPPLGPTGGAALYPLAAFDAVGGFDERIFAYLEDLDLSLRLGLVGLRCRLAPQARTVHFHSSTLGSGSAAKNALMGWSRGYILGRYRVLDSPRRVARALTCDLAICSGQIIVDRTVSGLPARIRGWRVGRRLPRREAMPSLLTDLTTLEALRLRSIRRRRAAGA